jgi:hypothetical protein
VIVLRHVGRIMVLFQSVIVIVIGLYKRYELHLQEIRTTNKYLSTKQKNIPVCVFGVCVLHVHLTKCWVFLLINKS